MISRNTINRKARINLACPVCGMELNDRSVNGYIFENETFCCQGCVEDTGCTCGEMRLALPKGGQRRGSLGQRNPENSVHDNNFNAEVTTSGQEIGHRHETDKAPSKMAHRGDRLPDGTKAPRSQSEERPSTREQARGRSEFVKRESHGTRTDRVSTTGSKST